jgi:hypothetical protein
MMIAGDDRAAVRLHQRASKKLVGSAELLAWLDPLRVDGNADRCVVIAGGPAMGKNTSLAARNGELVAIDQTLRTGSWRPSARSPRSTAATAPVNAAQPTHAKQGPSPCFSERDPNDRF